MTSLVTQASYRSSREATINSHDYCRVVSEKQLHHLFCLHPTEQSRETSLSLSSFFYLVSWFVTCCLLLLRKVTVFIATQLNTSVSALYLPPSILHIVNSSAFYNSSHMLPISFHLALPYTSLFSTSDWLATIKTPKTLFVVISN